MLPRRPPDLHHPPPESPNSGNLFPRLLSKDSSFSNPSFRIYYSAAAAAAVVPFLWESHPGTPKHATSSSPLPPLSPPPSSYISPQTKSPNQKPSFFSILPKNPSARKTSGKSPAPTSPPAASSCSSSLSSFSSTSDGGMSPTSALCFWERRRRRRPPLAGGKGGRRRYSMGGVKSMLLAVVGYGRYGSA